MLPEALRTPRVFGQANARSKRLGEDGSGRLQMTTNVSIDATQNFGGRQIVIPSKVDDASVAARVRPRGIERFQPEEHAGSVQQAGRAAHECCGAIRSEV